MDRKSKAAILVSTAFLSWVGIESPAFSMQRFYLHGHQIEGSMPNDEQDAKMLLVLLDDLSKHHDSHLQEAAKKALGVYETTPGRVVPKARAALTTFNLAAGGAVQLLSPKHKKVIAKVEELEHHEKSTGSGKSFDDIVENLGFLLTKTGTGEGSIKMSTTKLNELRRSLGESPVDTTKAEVEITQDEFSRLTTLMAGALEAKGEGGGGAITPKQMVSLFEKIYETTSEDDRNRDFENLVNFLIEKKKIASGDILNLFFFLHRIRITASKEQELREYASYYLAQLEDNSEFNAIAEQFNAEINNEQKKELMNKTGLVWNELKNSGDIDKFSLTKANKHTGYIKDHTAIPLINLLRKNPTTIFLKSTSAEIGKWKELLPYTPYDVIASLFYITTLYNIKPEAYAGNDTAKVGFLAGFLDALYEIAFEGKATWKAKPLPLELQDAFISFYGKQDDKIEKFNDYDDNLTGLYDPSTATAVTVADTRKFKLNLGLRKDYIARYNTPTPVKRTVRTGKVDTSKLSAIFVAPPTTPTKVAVPKKAGLSPEQLKLKREILTAIKRVLGKPGNAPLLANTMPQEVFMTNAMRDLAGKTESEIETYVQDKEKTGNLPWAK